MIKTVKDCVWAFDVEWVPDPVAGRLLHDVPEAVTDPREILELMWGAAGASDEDPTPFLKTVLCRIVSVAAVERKVEPDGVVHIRLTSLPRDAADPEQTGEAVILRRFFEGLGQNKPQLVGYNSIQSDLKILLQRGIVNGIEAAEFCERPNRPWEGVDYFARGNDWNVDLQDIIGGWGKSVPSLHQLATVSGIPGKMDIDGDQVAELWLTDRLPEIVRYNECDALTTYLVFLRLAHFAGHFSPAAYEDEQERVRALLRYRSGQPDGDHLARFLATWERLTRLRGDPWP